MGEKKDSKAYVSAMLSGRADAIMPHVDKYCKAQDSCLVCHYNKVKNCFMQRYIDERERLEESKQ